MQTDNHFEKLQHQYEAQQYLENENSTGDVSKVDKYKPHNYYCGSYSHKYSHLDADSNEDFDN
jgi:hypothetical protein